MALWCRDLPRVRVPETEMPHPVTAVYPYYECPRFALRQWGFWEQLVATVGRHLSVIVVDDGSPTHPAAAVLPRAPWLRIFRIEPDVPWNWLAARNIGAHHAAEGWLVLTDMDHVIPPETMRHLVYGQHDQAVVYAFGRVEHTGQRIHPHSASFYLTRQRFWQIGGYDERLSGVYGTDGVFRRRVAQQATIQILDGVDLIRHEYVQDASVSTYERKTPAMGEAKRKRFASVNLTARPKTLSFPYHEVTA